MKTGFSSLGVAGMALAAVLWIVDLSLAAESNMPMPSPQAVYDQAVRDAEPKGKGTGEGFCWHAAYHMRAFVAAYQASHDPAWLDAGVKYYDWCVGKMAVGPDGYQGWIGPADNGLWYDDHVGDAILVERMLEFSELVLKDPELKKKYGEAANRYVEIGKRDLIEKWDKRDTWREDGEYGAYVAHNKACAPEKLTEWKEVTEGVDEPPGRTLPFNKQNEMALGALRGNGPAGNSQAIVRWAYFQNVTLKTPPSLDRRYAKDAKVEQVPVTNCPSLTVATVLPHILSAKPSVVLCKSRLANDLEVAVYSADGKDKKCVLYQGKIGSGMNGQSDTLILTWDGTDPATKAKLPKGYYTVRWTVREGCREYVVTIPE